MTICTALLSCDGIAKTSSKRSERRIAGVAALAFLVAATLGSSSVLAGNSVGSFEIDGNLAPDHATPPAEPIDWLSNPFPASLTTFHDATGQGDNIFGMGSKENDQSSWVCTTGSAPQKDDVLDQISIPQSSSPVAGQIAFRFVGDKQFLYANWSRLSNNGNAHIDYEFNQNDPAVSPASPGCSQLPKRNVGDFLVSFDTDVAAGTIAVAAFSWNGATFVPLATGSQGLLWDAAVNPGPIAGLIAANSGLKDVSNLFGELTLDVSDTIGTIPCNQVLFVSMKTRASTSLSAELKDRTRAMPVNFTIFDSAGANAGGGAFAARLQDALLGLDTTLPAATPAGCTQGVCSSQSGPGSTSNGNQVLAVPPPPQPLLSANVLTASSTSTVDPASNAATDTSVAESAGVKVLGGLVTADVVRAVATAKATGFNASVSVAGSAFQNLVVNGAQLNNVDPNTRIDLPAAAFGLGSYVALLEETASISQPPAGQISGGSFVADVTVNMIHVHITGVIGGTEAADVIVSHASAHADFPQPGGCPALVGTVSGDATILDEQTDPAALPVLFGGVAIPAQGGHDHQDLDQLTTSAATSGTSVSDSLGSITSTTSTSTSYAQGQDVCVVPTGGACTVSVRALKSQANSTSGGGASSSNANGTSLLGVTVGSTMIGDNPAPNTCINVIPNVAVILNEQVCDGAGTLTCSPTGTPVTCSGSTSSGLTVRAVHVIVTEGGTLGLPAGANVIVGEAHADSSHP
jgi:hypothetical protein